MTHHLFSYVVGEELPPHSFFIHPVSAAVALGVLVKLEKGTKISFYNNCIGFQSPSYITSLTRTLHKADTFYNITHLSDPLSCLDQFKHLFTPEQYERLIVCAVEGLNQIKLNYCSDTDLAKRKCVNQLTSLYELLLKGAKLPHVDEEYSQFLSSNMGSWCKDECGLIISMLDGQYSSKADEQRRISFIIDSLRERKVVVSHIGTKVSSCKKGEDWNDEEEEEEKPTDSDDGFGGLEAHCIKQSENLARDPTKKRAPLLDYLAPLIAQVTPPPLPPLPSSSPKPNNTA